MNYSRRRMQSDLGTILIYYKLSQYNHQMKYFVTLSLCVILITSLSLQQAHQAVPESHQGISSSHQKPAATHDPQPMAVLQGVQAGLDIVSSAIDLGQKIAAMFPVTCSSSGYKRENKVTILNGLNREIRVSGNYQDSGKIFKHGLAYIPANKGTSWEFVKHSGSATGSNGVVVVDLADRTLVIFYENPWSSWNFAGVCIENKMSQHPTSGQMSAIYNRLYRSRPRWPTNCYLADNVPSKSVSFQRRSQLRSGGYRVGVQVKYQLIDKSGPNDCYNQEIIALVAKQ